MRFMWRWVSNASAFYLALYLLDSLVAPKFWVKAVWVAVILAVLLGFFNSLIRPLHRLKDRTGRALIVAFFTLAVNALVLQIFVWAGASLAATSAVWVLTAAAFLSVLGGVINWLVGFRSKEKPGASTRGRRAAARTEEREARRAAERRPV